MKRSIKEKNNLYKNEYTKTFSKFLQDNELKVEYSNFIFHFPVSILNIDKDIYFNEIDFKAISTLKFANEKFVEKYFNNFEENKIVYLLDNKKFSEKFFINHIHEFSDAQIKIMLKNQKLSENFINEYILNNINNYKYMKFILSSQILSYDFYKKHELFFKKENKTNLYVATQKVPENILTKFINNNAVSLKIVLEYQKVPESFLEKYMEIINQDDNWLILLKHQKISESFLMKHIPNLNSNTIKNIDLNVLNHIIEYQKVSESFLEKNILINVKSKIIEKKIFQYLKILILNKQKLSEDFIKRNYNDYKDDFDILLKNQNLSEKTLTQKLDNLDFTTNSLFYILKYYKELSEEFHLKISQFLNQDNKEALFSYQKVSEKVLYFHYDTFNENDIKLIIKNQNLSESFIEKLLNDEKLSSFVKFHHIFTYQKVSEKFIEKYISDFRVIDLQNMSMFQDLSKNFITKYPSKIYLTKKVLKTLKPKKLSDIKKYNYSNILKDKNYLILYFTNKNYLFNIHNYSKLNLIKKLKKEKKKMFNSIDNNYDFTL